jgi:hypothetical protein
MLKDEIEKIKQKGFNQKKKKNWRWNFKKKKKEKEKGGLTVWVNNLETSRPDSLPNMSLKLTRVRVVLSWPSQLGGSKSNPNNKKKHDFGFEKISR